MSQIINRKARHDYEILETYEVGIVLFGSEVKSIKMGNANLKDSYADIEKGEIWLYNFYISPYKFASEKFNHEPLRPKKLLLHKKEIAKLIGKTKEKGFTLIPLRVFTKSGLIKVELSLAKGKKLYDKRQSLKERELNLEKERALKSV